MNDHDTERRPPPTTRSGEEWRRVENFVTRLEETGDTPRSFVIKGVIGCAVPIVVALFLLWLIVKGVRAMFG